MTGTGLKKCMPDEPLAPLAGDRLGQPADRDRARVRGEDRRRRRARVELAPQRALDAEVLEDRLDDEVRIGDRGRGRTSASTPAERRVASLGASSRPFATDRSRLPAIRSRPASARARSGSYRSTLADRGMDLGDAMAHQPRTRHEDALDRHRSASVRAPSCRLAASATARGRRTGRGARRPSGGDRPPRRWQAPPKPGSMPASEARGPPATGRTRGRRTRLVVPTTAPRSISSTRDDGHRQERREEERDPDREDRGPESRRRPGRDQADDRHPDAPTRRARRPTARAAPIWSGSRTKTIRSDDDDQREHREERARPAHAELGGVQRDEREEARHAPHARTAGGGPGRTPLDGSARRRGRSPSRRWPQRGRRGLRHEQGQHDVATRPSPPAAIQTAVKPDAARIVSPRNGPIARPR